MSGGPSLPASRLPTVHAGDQAGSKSTTWIRRHWRPAVAVAAGLIALIAIGAAVSWHFSSAVLVPDRSDWPDDATVEQVSLNRIVLARSKDSERPGVYGLDWQAGHAVIGAVTKTDADTVTRKLRAVRGYLAPGMKVAIDSEIYSGNPGEALGLPFSNVLIPGELGSMPAWMIPGHDDTWAIVVHGINGDPQIGLRIAPPCTAPACRLC